MLRNDRLRLFEAAPEICNAGIFFFGDHTEKSKTDRVTYGLEFSRVFRIRFVGTGCCRGGHVEKLSKLEVFFNILYI